MAIVFETQKKPVNWIMLLSIVFTIGFIVFGTYYLFFAPVPRIDVVLPEPLKQANQISSLHFIDPNEVVNSSTFQSFQMYFGPPGTGALGRTNPFAPF